MMEVPNATPVNTPVDETVAMPGAEDDHEPPGDASARAEDVPTQTEGIPAIGARPEPM